MSLMLLRELSKENLVGLLQGLHQLTEDSLKAQLYTDVSILSSAIAALNDETNMVPLKADKFPSSFTKVEDTTKKIQSPSEKALKYVSGSDNLSEQRLPCRQSAEPLVVKPVTVAEIDEYSGRIQKPSATINDISDEMFKELIIDSLKAISVRIKEDATTSYQLLHELESYLNSLYPGYTDLKSPTTKGKLHWMVMFSRLSLRLVNDGQIVKQGARFYSLPKAQPLITEEAVEEAAPKSKLEIREIRPKNSVVPVTANSPYGGIHKTSQLFKKAK